MIGYAVLMQRFRPAVLVVLAVLLLAQLGIHHHSLVPEAAGAPALACAVCAFGADQGVLDTPVFAAALVLVGLIAARHDAPIILARSLVRAGRAPPAR
jgi:hypothetical protein